MAPRLKVEIESPRALLTPSLRPDCILDVWPLRFNLRRPSSPRDCVARVQAYDGDKATLGKAEQFFLEIAKVPRYSARTRALQVRSPLIALDFP